MTRRRTWVAYAIVILAATVAAGWAWNEARRGTERVAVRSSQALRESQLAGCERGRADRQDAIRGWTAARVARRQTAHNPDVAIRERLQAAAAASVYRDVIAGYRARIVDCSAAFPPVKVP